MTPFEDWKLHQKFTWGVPLYPRKLASRSLGGVFSVELIKINKTNFHFMIIENAKVMVVRKAWLHDVGDGYLIRDYAGRVINPETQGFIYPIDELEKAKARANRNTIEQTLKSKMEAWTPLAPEIENQSIINLLTRLNHLKEREND